MAAWVIRQEREGEPIDAFQVEEIEVPEPGEYVALGATVQAAWVLTGDRPAWTPEALARPDAAPVPLIREQYAAHAAV